MFTSATQKFKERLRFNWWAPYRINRYPSYNSSHSQFGEDMVASALFPLGMKGTYVDIGAHHPVFYSNTYHFYRRGWSGLVVDATPKLVQQFATLRPRDKAVCACLGSEAGREVVFYRFNSSPYDTTDAEAAAAVQKLDGVKLIASVPMRTQTLDMLLDQYLPASTIDLLTIDIEGMDEFILRSFDWRRRQPRVIVFERHGLNLRDIAGDALINFMLANQYDLYGTCGLSVIMVHNTFEKLTRKIGFNEKSN